MADYLLINATDYLLINGSGDRLLLSEPAAGGNAVYPDVSDVRSGVQYGPNGDDYTGTLVVGAGTYFPGLLF